jgi:8-oxo-dGTP pyrophosphatase MutT (NUDIX family)
VVFHTPWFDIMSQTPPGDAKPYYSLRGLDYAMVVALNPQGQLLLVRQYRPAVGIVTLELPAGHVEVGETPEQAARKELCEETGCEADTLELLAVLRPSTARFTNRAHIFFAANVRPAARPAHPREADVEASFHSGSIRELLDNPEFVASGSYAGLMAAAVRGKIKL